MRLLASRKKAVNDSQVRSGAGAGYTRQLGDLRQQMADYGSEIVRKLAESQRLDREIEAKKQSSTESLLALEAEKRREIVESETIIRNLTARIEELNKQADIVQLKASLGEKTKALDLSLLEVEDERRLLGESIQNVAKSRESLQSYAEELEETSEMVEGKLEILTARQAEMDERERILADKESSFISHTEKMMDRLEKLESSIVSREKALEATIKSLEIREKNVSTAQEVLNTDRKKLQSQRSSLMSAMKRYEGAN